MFDATLTELGDQVATMLLQKLFFAKLVKKENKNESTMTETYIFVRLSFAFSSFYKFSFN